MEEEKKKKTKVKTIAKKVWKGTDGKVIAFLAKEKTKEKTFAKQVMKVDGKVIAFRAAKEYVLIPLDLSACHWLQVCFWDHYL